MDRAHRRAGALRREPRCRWSTSRSPSPPAARSTRGQGRAGEHDPGLLDAGAGGLDEQTIADRKADLGIELSGGTDNDRASMALRSLSSPAELDAAVELAATLLARPDFPAAVLERERSRAIAGLREAPTKPATLAARQFNAALYAGHPYGHDSTPESLAAIGRDDLVDFHRRHYGANRATVAIVGDDGPRRRRAHRGPPHRGLPATEAAMRCRRPRPPRPGPCASRTLGAGPHPRRPARHGARGRRLLPLAGGQLRARRRRLCRG